jgi:hypothetical protein
MASTYSNLKIQLMATGENSTTWGNVTNINLGTAIEEAITGSADVAFSSANVTLTLTDTNASQTARNLRLNLTGTATGGYNLVVPTIEKAYIVNNGTDGTITVKTAAGSGIAVPAGKTTWVFADGVNVVSVVSHLASLALASALPVSSGGTGAVTLTGYVKGSGTSALTASATVPTSDLSGSISLTTQVSGTLPLANGGTNATTAAGARTSLGSTTLGDNLFTITNPSAITFPQFNADNTVSALSASSFRTAISAAQSGTNTDITTMNPASGLQVGSPTGGAKGAGTINATGLYINGTAVGTASGSVTSVAMTVPTFLSVTGSPITTSGTLAVSLSGTALPVANGGTGGTSASAALTSLGAYAASNPSGYTSNTGTVTSVSGTGSVNGLSLTGTVTSSGSLTLGGSITSVATTATINSYIIGYLQIPRSTTSSTATTGDVGKCIAVTAGITIPNSTFAAGDAISIYNDSASAITITASITTLRLAGTTTTGNRTLAARGMATIWFNSATEAVISGAGVS